MNCFNESCVSFCIKYPNSLLNKLGVYRFVNVNFLGDRTLMQDPNFKWCVQVGIQKFYMKMELECQ